MANRSLADFAPTTAGACDDDPSHADERSFDRSIFHDDASFEALLRELAAGGVSPAMALPKTGEVIAGKYRIEEKLGQGGMGIVYRATHRISGKQVALKWMLSACSDGRARGRFVREARAAARIDHRNVVDIYDIGQDGDRGLYMVMQLLRGESLAQRLSRGRLGIEETVDLLLPAMRGVAAVHAAGVIHRDLKPDNIFLCEAPPGGRSDALPDAKVLDFGISSVTAPEEGDHTLTRDGALVGTLAYMSPEQIQDSRAVDAQTDVYAFGVILYEALTGRQPFRADSHNGLVLAIIDGHPEDPRQLRADIPPAMAEVVLRALSKRRADRFADVESLIEALSVHDLYAPSEPSCASLNAFQSSNRALRRRAAALGAVLLTALGVWWWSESRIVLPHAGAHTAKAERTAVAVKQRIADEPAVEPAALSPASDAATPSHASSPSAPRTGSRRISKRKPSLPIERTQPEPAPSPAKAAARSGKIAFEEL